MRDDVWYAAYGSNLCRSRLLCYLRGGRPEGATRTYPGCRDRSPPREEVAGVVPHRLYFAGHSTVWGGAVAFVETARDPSSRTHVRLYRLGLDQFVDLHDQDNRTGTRARIDLAHLRRDRVVVGGDGWYDAFVHLGERDGVPIVTFTASDVTVVGELAAPSADYLRTMAQGLSELDGLAPGQVARYLASAPGARGRIGATEVEAALSRSR